MADLGRKALERGGRDGECREELRMPVALHDLGCRRLGLEPEPLAGDALDLGIDRRIVADGARELSDANSFERARDPAPGAVELEGPDRELQAEGRRLGVDAVRAADRERQAVLVRPLHHRGEGPVDPIHDQLARSAKLERERRVDHVGRGEPVVEPAACLSELARRLRRRRRRGRAGSSPRFRPRARGSAPSPSHESPGPPRPERRRPPPRRRGRRARPRATARACPRPTRSWPWPGGSSGKSPLRV